MNRDVDLRIMTAELPVSISGFSMPKNGKTIVVINEGLTESEQAAAFLHECLHIWHDDHNSQTDADTLERIRHKELIEILTGILEKDS